MPLREERDLTHARTNGLLYTLEPYRSTERRVGYELRHIVRDASEASRNPWAARRLDARRDLQGCPRIREHLGRDIQPPSLTTRSCV